VTGAVASFVFDWIVWGVLVYGLAALVVAVVFVPVCFRNVSGGTLGRLASALGRGIIFGLLWPVVLFWTSIELGNLLVRLWRRQWRRGSRRG
jgi:uncharacterized membrane protein